MRTLPSGGATLVLVLAALQSAGAQATRGASRDPLAGFDAYATRAMAEWKVPGMAVAVVRGDSVVFAKGYGVRAIGDTARVDPRTIFAIGSASKAFTGAALAMLAEEGKLSLDGRVTEYLPYFQMYDPWVTREIRVRDLLLHRSGLPGGELLWYGTNRSREDIVRSVRRVAPSTSFRTRFQYQNLMYITAGEVVHEVSSQSWDDFVSSRIFAPLGMTQTNTSVRNLAQLPDVASPHAEVAGSVRIVPWRNIDNAAAAGSINSNVLDMSRWIRLWLGAGTFEGRRLLTEASVREAVTSHFMVDDQGMVARLMSPKFLGYGFGWFISEHRGRRLVSHGGNIDGMAALVSFLPDDGVGVVILTNMNQSDVTFPLTANLFDRLLGMMPRDWAAEYREAERQYDARQQAGRKAPARVAGTRPSLPLTAYAGVYRNELLGTATVTADAEGRLSVRYDANPTAVGDLEHWNFDSFMATMRDPMLGKIPVTFRLGNDGRVMAMSFALGGAYEWTRQE